MTDDDSNMCALLVPRSLMDKLQEVADEWRERDGTSLTCSEVACYFLDPALERVLSPHSFNDE